MDKIITKHNFPLLNGNYKLISIVKKDNKTRAILKCSIHNTEFNCDAYQYKNGKLVCKQCYKDNQSIANKKSNATAMRKGTHSFQKFSKDERIENSSNAGKISAEKTKAKGYSSTRMMLSPKERSNISKKAYKTSMENGLKNFGLINGNNVSHTIEFISEFLQNLSNGTEFEIVSINNETLHKSVIKIRNKNTGETYEKTYSSIYRNKNLSLNNNYQELLVGDMINSIDSSFIPQYKISHSDSSYQFFDWYSEKHKMAIEYDGIQHREGGFNKPLSYYAIMDSKKNEYCKMNNIFLFRINSELINNKEVLYNEIWKFIQIARTQKCSI